MEVKTGGGDTPPTDRPEDEPMMVKFHGTLSDQTVYLRYFHMEKLSTRVAHERLIQKCFIDYDREMAMVAERIAPETGRPEVSPGHRPGPGSPPAPGSRRPACGRCAGPRAIRDLRDPGAADEDDE